MTTALFPGSFDPPTLGHVNIIERAARIFPRIIVLISDNPNKNYMFSKKDRLEMVEKSVEHIENIVVDTFDGLTVEYARTHSVDVMIRGVRPWGDFSYEIELSIANKVIAPDIDTIFMPTNPEYSIIRSSQIREMIEYGAPFSSMVPKIVEEKILKG